MSRSDAPTAVEADAIRLLVVDDSSDTRELLALFLTSAGYDVTTADSAEQGLERLEEGGYSVVLTDHFMPPGENGAWMLRVAAERELLRGVVALMYTGSREPERPDGVRVIPKGSDMSVLVAAIDDGLSAALAERVRRASSRIDRRPSRRAHPTPRVESRPSSSRRGHSGSSSRLAPRRTAAQDCAQREPSPGQGHQHADAATSSRTSPHADRTGR
jgi:CheY-like chemotaxis protein